MSSMQLRTGSLAGARFLVTERSGGVSVAPYDTLNLGGHVGDDPDAVAENRRRVAARASSDSADPVDPVDSAGSVDLVLMSQVHGTSVATVTGRRADGEPVALPEADAMVTDRPGVALAVLVADCTPVLLAQRGGAAIGVAHAGRRGMAAGVVATTVSALGELGARPQDLVAHLGPSICAACYEVSPEVHDEVVAVAPAAAARSRAGTPALDVRAGLLAQLTELGVEVATPVDDRCTPESPELYSYRRDGVTGRFAAVLWREA